jgi:spermidine synthase
MIYGINTIGGAMGVLLAGLVLIERLGLTATVNVATGFNVAVGLAALVLLGSPLGRGDARSSPPDRTAIPTYLPRRLTGVVLFVSGCLTLSYEILWFRALRYTVGNSTYALTTVLFIFLAGLGLGALLLRRVASRRSPERDLALCQCAIAVLALAAVACQSVILSVPALVDYVSIYSQGVRAQPWWWRLLIDGAIAAMVMLPATVFMGLSFPLASRLYLGDVRKLSTRVGGAYLLANLGSILGSLLGALILLPHFGTIGGTKVVAVGNLVLGIAVMAWIRKRATGLLPRAVGAAALVLALTIILPSALTFRGELIDDVEGEQVFVEEADLATVQVLAKPGDPHKKAMTVDGYKIGWSAAFEGTAFYRKQVLLAHLPMLLDSRIRHTLNIGLGSATTLKTLATYPEVETLDCVEISVAVVRASRLFEASSVLEDPRVNLVVDDVIHYMRRSAKKYDAIISDGKQHPFFAGNATLLCREFYRSALDDLTEDGLFIQWIPLGTLGSDFQIILRTLGDVFPHLEVFYYPMESVLMVGSRRPLAGRPGLDAERYRSLPVQDDLTRYSFDHPTSVLALWAGSKRQILQTLAETSISTWDHLRLDFSAFKATPGAWKRSPLENLSLLAKAEQVPRAGTEATFDLGDTAYLKSASLVRRAWVELFAGRVTNARALAEQAVDANPADRMARGIRGTMRSYETMAKQKNR